MLFLDLVRNALPSKCAGGGHWGGHRHLDCDAREDGVAGASGASGELATAAASVGAASAAAVGVPLGLLKEKVAIISGRHDDDEILEALHKYENIAIMKAGKSRPRLMSLIEQSGRQSQVSYIEFATQENERKVLSFDELEKVPGPYFSLFLVNGERAYG